LSGLDRRPLNLDDLPIPTSERDLRETFDLPLVSAREAERGEVAAGPAAADATTLFKDEPAARRLLSAAEARATGRRCSTCGGYVPQGMSICSACGTDQETGMRVGLEDDLAPPPPQASQGPPLHVSIIGGICGTVGITLMLLGAIQSTRGASNYENYAWLAMALISAFAIYACAQFIRGKSAKLLMVALAVGATLDVAAMIVWPIVCSIVEDPDQIVKEVKPQELDDSSVGIRPFEERIDTHRITMGVGFILVYAVLSLYLMSPPVKRYILNSRSDRGV
jgi:hypothetical protein